MNSKKVQKRFNFPGGEVRLTKRLGHRVEVEQSGAQRFTISFPDEESRDDFFQYAAEELYAALSSGDPFDLHMETVLRRGHSDKSYLQGSQRLAGQSGAVSAYAEFTIDVEPFVYDKHVSLYPGCITVRLGNGETFDLYFEDVGVVHLYGDDETMRFGFDLNRLELDHIVEQNRYFPAWSELAGATVVSVFLDACDRSTGEEFGTESGLAKLQMLSVTMRERTLLSMVTEQEREIS